MNKLRLEQLKRMDQLLRTCNDLSLLSSWYICGVPSGATLDDLIEIANDTERYNECVEIFKRIVANKGFYIL